MDSEHTLDVHWESPQPVDTMSAEPSHVLYQLTGVHSVYGSDTLLYIGKTLRESPRTRLQEHVRSWASLEPDSVQVRLASIGEFKNWSDWHNDINTRYSARPENELVEAVEKLLIYVHQPTYNSREKQQARALSNGHLRIFNTGRYGRLLPEISTRRYRDLSGTGLIPRTPDETVQKQVR